MPLTASSRRDFLSHGVRLTAAGSLMMAGMSSAARPDTPPVSSTPPPAVAHYQLLNVRLEEDLSATARR